MKGIANTVAQITSVSLMTTTMPLTNGVDMKFLPKDRVIIDGDPDLVAVITVVRLLPDSAPTYQIEWFDAGTAKDMSIEEFRLMPEPSQ